ncbi:helix-turn-helix domain-containing protein [Sphingomonas sp. UYP23]
MLKSNLPACRRWVLVTIENTGSFSAAARALRGAQSAIRQTVATRETAQGVVLFDRSGHRPVLTELGVAARNDDHPELQ